MSPWNNNVHFASFSGTAFQRPLEIAKWDFAGAAPTGQTRHKNMDCRSRKQSSNTSTGITDFSQYKGLPANLKDVLVERQGIGNSKQQGTLDGDHRI
jgi:hypothetical protein